MSKIAPTVTLIDAAMAKTLVKVWNKGSKAFMVANVKKDGQARVYNVLPAAGRAQIKGTGKPLPLNSDMIHVFDGRVAQPRNEKGRFMPIPANADGWRTLNTATVTELRRGHEVYKVA
jgi:hypothetical protein